MHGGLGQNVQRLVGQTVSRLEPAPVIIRPLAVGVGIVPKMEVWVLKIGPVLKNYPLVEHSGVLGRLIPLAQSAVVGGLEPAPENVHREIPLTAQEKKLKLKIVMKVLVRFGGNGVNSVHVQLHVTQV